MPACLELEVAFRDAWSDQTFIDEYQRVLREFAGRPTPITPLPRISAALGIRLFAKREDLAHTGSHKINNVVGQTLLTKRDNTVSPPRPPPLVSAWRARCSWVRSIPSASRSMCFAWNCSVRRWSR